MERNKKVKQTDKERKDMGHRQRTRIEKERRKSKKREEPREERKRMEEIHGGRMLTCECQGRAGWLAGTLAGTVARRLTVP